MKRLLFTSFIVLACTITVYSKTPGNGAGEGTKWEFYTAVQQPTSADLANISSDDNFGKESIFLLKELKNMTYTKEQVVPGDPTTRPIIHKEDIYNAIMSIQKGLKRDLKQNAISSNEASSQYAHALYVAISAFLADDSKSFESALHNSRKDYKEQLSIFNNVTLKD